MRRLLILTAVLRLTGPDLLTAQEPMERGPLQLWDCVELAVRQNPRAVAERWRIVEADRSVTQARAEFSPELKLNGFYNVNTYIPEINFPGRSIRLGDHDDTGVTLQADYLVYDWGRRQRSLEAESSRMDAAGLSLGAAKQELAWRAGRAFLAMQGAANESRVAGLSVETAQAHLEELNALYANGVLTYDQVLDGQVRLERTRVLLRRAENQIRLARADLLLAMGLPLDSRVEFVDTVQGVPGPPMEGYSLERAITARPDLTSFQARIAELNLRQAAVEAGKKPDVRMFASGTVAKPGIDQFRNDLIEYVRAGVSFNWTFWDGRRKDWAGSRLQAQREQLTAEAKVQAGLVALELERAELEEQEVRDRLELILRALEAAGESFRLVSDRFDEGRATNTEFLDAEEQLTANRLDHARALIELEMAHWRLAWVSGSLYQELNSRWPDMESAAAPVDAINESEGDRK